MGKWNCVKGSYIPFTHNNIKNEENKKQNKSWWTALIFYDNYNKGCHLFFSLTDTQNMSLLLSETKKNSSNARDSVHYATFPTFFSLKQIQSYYIHNPRRQHVLKAALTLYQTFNHMNILA